MVHPVTGADYVTEQAFNAVVAKAKTEFTATLETAAETAVDEVLDATIDTKVAAAVLAADISGKVDTAIAALSLPAVTVADTAPTTPVDGHIWVDTTGATEILNVYSGTEWLVVTATPAT
jgi:hypothetical protein